MGKKESSAKINGSKFEAAVGRWCLRILFVIVPLVILDIASPWFITTRAPIEQKFALGNTRKPEPYTMFKGERNSKILPEESLNELGYRGSAPSATKGINEYRIIILGGSTVFVGEPPITTLLQQQFEANGLSNIRIYNFGVVSSVSSQELARILFEIVDLKPDLIAMYNGANDIWQNHLYDPRPGYPFNFIAYELNPLLESDVRSYPAITLFFYGSNLVRNHFRGLLRRQFLNLDEIRKSVNYGSEQWQDKIAEIYVNNLIKADKISAAFNAEFVAFFQPVVFYKDVGTEKEENMKKAGPEFTEHMLEMRTKVLAKIQASGIDIPRKFVDLSDIYDQTPEEVFTDFIHTRQDAKILVAEAIYEHIIKTFNPK
ncbi:hypothetical protein ES703_91980 [subsurface metagenome]